MKKPNPEAIDRILRSRDFKLVIDQIRANYTTIIMSPNTSDDEALATRRANTAMEIFIEALTKATKG